MEEDGHANDEKRPHMWKGPMDDGEAPCKMLYCKLTRGQHLKLRCCTIGRLSRLSFTNMPAYGIVWI